MLVMPLLVFAQIQFLSLSLASFSLINPNDIDYSKIQISGEKTYDETYDDLILSVFSTILG